MNYRLGSLEIDPANFLLTESGKPVSVEPLVFDLIVYLVENRDRVLTREELLDNIWAGRIVSDTSLSSHIKSARKALGDDGQRQRVIKTVHGRGYRFVAEIDESAVRDDAVTKIGSTGVRRPSRTKLAIYTASVVVLLAIVSGVWLLPSEDAIESIAVLPLKNLSNDPAQKYFVEGMQDALITRLTRITELRVISKTSTLRYEDAGKSIPEIARELNVDALIEGSVFREADRVRITAQLIRGSGDEQLWAKSYDRDLDSVLTLINDISLAIADEVEVTVNQQDTEDRTRKPASLQVHELVLQGHHYFDRFQVEQSLHYFQQAAELDPEFAPAHAGVAGSYFLMGFFNWSPDSAFISKARAAAWKAVTLDAKSAGGYSALGAIQLYFDWDWESANANLLRALELGPNDARTRHVYADYLMVMGDLEGSLNQVEIGRLYDPLSPMAASVVDFHRTLVRQYDQIIEEGRRAVAADPGSLSRLPHYREALWLNGMHEEAFEVYEASWGMDPELLGAMEKGYAESGYPGAMHRLADTLAGRDGEFFEYVTLAKLYVRAGEHDEALTWLEKAYEHRHPQILHIKAMPGLDPLRSSPEFQDLLRRIGFPEGTR